MKKLIPFPSIEEVSIAVNDVIEGGSNATGTVSLSSDPLLYSTTVFNKLCRSSSVPILCPRSYEAAAETGLLHISSVENGSFTIAHSGNTGNRTFSYVLLGG